MSEYGLRSVHMGCLLYIGQSEKGMTITQLSKSCKTDKALIKWTLASEEIHNLYDERWRAACADVYDYGKVNV